MARTSIGPGSAQAVKRWSLSLSIDYMRRIYWRKFMGRGSENIIEEKTELESDAGDNIKFDINLRMVGEPVYGDNRLEGNEEQLRFSQDELNIDQVRKAGSAGGRMTRKRTIHDLRMLNRARLAEYFAEWTDEILFAYASGVNDSTVVNANRIFRSSSFAGNALTQPDSDHIAYGSDGAGAGPTSKATLGATDLMSVNLVENVNTRVRMFNTSDIETLRMRPVQVGPDKHYVLVMSPYQSRDLRRSSTTADWLEIQKNAGMRSEKNPIFTGALGMIDGTVLQMSESVRLFSDYGPGNNVAAARALFLSSQALTCAYGGGRGQNASGGSEQLRQQGAGLSRMQWVEEAKDYGNEISVAGGMIFGCKKTRFNERDYGVVAVDTAYTEV